MSLVSTSHQMQKELQARPEGNLGTWARASRALKESCERCPGQNKNEKKIRKKAFQDSQETATHRRELPQHLPPTFLIPAKGKRIPHNGEIGASYCCSPPDPPTPIDQVHTEKRYERHHHDTQQQQPEKAAV